MSRWQRFVRWWQADTNGWPTAIFVWAMLAAAIGVHFL